MTMRLISREKVLYAKWQEIIKKSKHFTSVIKFQQNIVSGEFECDMQKAHSIFLDLQTKNNENMLQLLELWSEITMLSGETLRYALREVIDKKKDNNDIISPSVPGGNNVETS